VEFVDHTVMEHLENYARLAKLNEKDVHIENVDELHPVSNHPLASRDRNSKAKFKNIKIEARTLQLLSYAHANDYEFQNKVENNGQWDFYNLSIRKQIISIKNLIRITNGSYTYEIADIKTQKGALSTADIENQTVLKISGTFKVPKFYMHKTDFIDRLKESLGHKEINFPEHKKFSERYTLRSDQMDTEVGTFFTSNLIQILEGYENNFLSGNGTDLLIHFDEKILTQQDIELLIKAAKLISEAIIK
jgi:hypothetical protein